MTNKVMVINKGLANLTKDLQVMGYAVLTASSEKDLQHAILCSPDLIVLGTNYKLCECLTGKTNIPMIMLLADELTKDKVLKRECIDLLEGTEISVLNKIVTHLRISNIETITKQLYNLIN